MPLTLGINYTHNVLEDHLNIYFILLGYILAACAQYEIDGEEVVRVTSV